MSEWMEERGHNRDKADLLREAALAGADDSTMAHRTANLTMANPPARPIMSRLHTKRGVHKGGRTDRLRAILGLAGAGVFGNFPSCAAARGITRKVSYVSQRDITTTALR